VPRGAVSPACAGEAGGVLVALQIPNRVLARFVASRRRCGNCKHFDLEEGQRGLRKMGVFSAVIDQISPAQMAASKSHADEPDPVAKAPMPKGVRWEDFGACQHNAHDDAAVWRGHVCGDWE